MKAAKSIVVMVLLCSVIFSMQARGSAATDGSIEDLEPVLYEKLKFNKNTDYLHDAGKIEMKNTLPEKQFNLHFDGSRRLPARGDSSYLFRTDVRGERSTVAARSKEIGLFTKTAVRKNEATVSSYIPVEQQRDSNGRTLLFVLLIVIGTVILFTVFIPKTIQESPVRERKRRKTV
ncbi:hypothetical protein NCCP2222_09600 [Sporosarcina sp. NCCP-2222]|uniref:type VII secretion EssA family protein n=1 Tax=Sporosarcina sp. NCCP-2222 TaxID=2935073 RepID=UPI00207DD039|nr:type VII secretion EssA family protein [Sporosarcina sp. NCCP-2222]GKV55013.1 hypothetical protein NCCP2222_09600 [Sporosarcina sp. NCCP-2222]